MTVRTLFEPIKIGTMDVKNRFVVPPMGTCYANDDSTVPQKMVDYYGARAKGGYGLIITEVTAVDRLGWSIRTEVGLWDDKFIPGYKEIIDECHKYDAKVAIQLHHAGRQTNENIIGYQPVAPSAIPDPASVQIPRELTTEEVYETIQKFVDAARRAREAGADAVELHGAHGYLITQFMSSYVNKRTDEFGGSFVNRMRFLTLIIKGIKEQVDNKFPILFRISADEGVPGGRSLEESCAIARMVEGMGVDAIHVSASVNVSAEWLWAPSEIRPGYISNYAAAVKKSVSIPVITVGRYSDPYVAEDVILSGKADMVSFGRQSLTDPDLPNKFAAGKFEEVAPCIACHQGCANNIIAAKPLTCLVNPFVGREKERIIEKTGNPKKILIVGGGPAGLETAWIAAKRGHDVDLYEKTSVLGGQFRTAAFPRGKGELTAPISYFRHMCLKYGVKFHMNTEVTEELIAGEEPDAVVIATGATPKVPDIEGIDKVKFSQAIDVLEGRVEIGENVLILGGGKMGTETADYLNEFERNITVIARSEAMKGMHAAHKIKLVRRLKEAETTILTHAKIKKFTDENTAVIEQEGKEFVMNGYDDFIMAIGVEPYNPLEEKIKGKVDEVFIIGDAREARDALYAIDEASKLACEI